MYSTLQFIISQLKERGLKQTDILNNTDICAATLTDPWPYLNHQQYSQFVTNIYQLCNDEAIGLKLNEPFQARHLGIPGYAALCSPTFAEARKVMMKYRVLKDPFIFLTHHMQNNDWLIEFSGAYPAEEAIQRFSMEGHLIRTARFCEDLTGHNRSIQAVSLRYPAPDYKKLYEQLLPFPVQFNAEKNTIHFDHNVLAEPLPAANSDMLTLCQKDCDEKLIALDENSAYHQKVYQELFNAHSKDNNNLLSLYDVANRLYISPRTLRRKLLNEESSFKIISNEVRRDLALHYLTNTGLSAKEISYILGYSSVNNFHRAFKQWTGKPISSFQ